jgi:hypothetical protein
MDTFSLYCKSYRGDLDRAKVLAESVQKYNKDNIPFYFSVPTEDIELFKSAIPDFTILSDADIMDTLVTNKFVGWVSQQMVKSNFWKLGLSKNYLVLDSDCQFITDFKLDDFMYDEETPYTVCHEQKELWNWSVLHTHELGFNPKISFTEDRLRIMELFGRSGKVLDFGPGPVIWSAEVWRVLETVLESNNLTWVDIMKISPSEFTWYGETLMYSQAIRLVPREPLFKAFHYYQQYVEYKQRGITLDHIAQNYLGIGLQSNWPTKILHY